MGSFLHVRSVEIRLNYTGRNPLIETCRTLVPAGSAARIAREGEHLRTWVATVPLLPFPGVMGEAQGHPSSHRGRRDVYVRPEIRRVAFSSHGGLDATSEIPAATGFWHIRVSSVHDAAHRSLHAPLRRRLVRHPSSPAPPGVSLFSPGFSRRAGNRRTDFDAEIHAISICRRKLNVRRTCIAIHQRHLPRHGPADLPHDLIHVERLQWDTRPQSVLPPSCLRARSARSDVIG